MARPNGLSASQFCVARSISGVIAADNSTLTDANIPVASALDCRGFETIFVGPEITAGTNPTATYEVLFRDGDAADGSRWKRLLLGAAPGVTLGSLASETTGALVNGQMAELRVHGHSSVFIRITAVANATSTTAHSILAIAGKPRGSFNRWV